MTSKSGFVTMNSDTYCDKSRKDRLEAIGQKVELVVTISSMAWKKPPGPFPRRLPQIVATQPELLPEKLWL